MTIASDLTNASSKLIFYSSIISWTVFYRIMWHCLAMAAAVTGWSPVTIITLIPAAWHFKTANGTESLGGSVSETTPTKHCCVKGKLGLSTLNLNP